MWLTARIAFTASYDKDNGNGITNELAEGTYNTTPQGFYNNISTKTLLRFDILISLYLQYFFVPVCLSNQGSRVGPIQSPRLLEFKRLEDVTNINTKTYIYLHK